MLNQPYYYYRTLRKIITAFGSLFNGIQMVTYNYDLNPPQMLNSITVPLTYEGKETYVTRLFSDPTALLGVQKALPSMTYDWVGMRYNAARKQSSYVTNQIFNNSSGATQQYLAVPYDLQFEVNLYVRNFEDGAQIIEQIIPLFTPDYTIAVKYLTSGSNFISQNMPIVFENIRYLNDYEGTAGKVRYITWTLDFNVQALFYGPLPQQGLIDDVIINLRDSYTGNLDASVSVSQANANANIVTVITETANVWGVSNT